MEKAWVLIFSGRRWLTSQKKGTGTSFTAQETSFWLSYVSFKILDLFLFLSSYLKVTLQSTYLFIYFFCSLLVSLMMTHKRLNEDDDHTRISSFIFLCGVLKTWPKILQPKPVVLYLEKIVIDLLLTCFFFSFSKLMSCLF